MRRLGCKIPNAGDAPKRLGIAEMATAAEAAGADSLWVPDHVVLLESVESRYPYSDKGLGRRADEDYYHPLISLAWMAAATTTAELGTAVFILPQRNAVETAKYVSTLDALSGGRVVLGVGAGWCSEEFELLDADFRSRFKRLDEQIGVLRHLWSGTGAAFKGTFHDIPEGTYCLPRPATEAGPPLLVGGMADGPLHRAARIGDGWLALVSNALAPDFSDVEAALKTVLAYREQEETDRPFRTTVRAQVPGGSDYLEAARSATHRLFDMGFDEVIIDPGWESIEKAQEIIAQVRSEHPAA
jgi:probable F420-dependent oxidoreductase